MSAATSRLSRRTALVVGAALALGAWHAQAAGWPNKPVRLIVPIGPGSSPDIFARLLAASLQKDLGQPIVVDNRNGASGSLALDQTAKAAPDGYTLAVAYPAPLTTNNLMMKKVPYDSEKDIQPITNAVLQPTVLVIGNHLEVTSFDQLAALLKKSPGKYNSASTGASSLGRLLAEALARQLGTSIQNVVYNGAAPSMVALMRGEVDFAFLPAAGVMAFANADKVKVIAVAANQRSALLPKTPTLKEFGLDQLDGSNWLGIVGPAGLKPDDAAAIRKAVLTALESPELRKSLNDNYMEVIATTPAEFSATMRQDTERWRPLIQQLGISMD